MRKQLLFIAALTLCICIVYNATAQGKISIDKVYSVTLRNSGAIIENEMIKGYYFFYLSDKIDRKTNEYTLQVVDENLNKIKDIKFTDSKDIVLLESSFNGDAVNFLFYNDKENTLDYRMYGMNGKQLFTYSKTLDKLSEAWFKTQMANDDAEESQTQNIYDIPGKGFISVTPLRENRKYTYDVNFYASDKRKTWTYNPIEDGKYAAAQYLGANDSIALIEVLTKDKLLSKEMGSTILGLHMQTGKKAFEMRTQDGKYQFYPTNISKLKNSNDFLVMGLYYEGNDRVVADKSQGLGIWLLNNQGKIVKSKYVSWEKDLGKHLKVDQRGQITDLGYLYVHRIMQTEDGKLFALGEGYRKVADGVGIAMNVLSGSYSNGMTKLKITDMVMMEFSPTFELTNARIFPKNDNSFSLNTGSDFATPHTLAMAAKVYGAFDYTFTQMTNNSTAFSSSFTDYEKTKGYKGMTFNSISYFNGKLTVDKINLSTEATRIRVLPAKPGSVLLVEYFRKDKRLDLRMEKLN